METKRKRIIGFGLAIGIVLIASVFALAQWGPQNGYWQVGSGGFALNCPANSCSVVGSVLNFPGLSAKSQLVADSAGSSSTALINTGISFPIAANQNGTLNCEIFYTSSNSSGGLSLAVNGPGSPTEVTAAAQIQTSATAVSLVSTQGTSWATTIGTVADTLTSGIQLAELSGGIENGATAGTLSIQFADINTSGTVTVKRDSWCSFP